MKLSELKEPNFDGVVESAEIMPLQTHLLKKGLSEESIEKFNNLDRDHLVIWIKIGEASVDAFFMLPTAQGGPKSNLAKLVKMNPSWPDVDLTPKGVGDLVGQRVKMTADAQGYSRVRL